MTTPEAIAAGIERRAEEMFAEDSEGLSVRIEWRRLDDHLREAYRASARKELETLARRDEMATV
jgi:hypothetical protein